MWCGSDLNSAEWAYLVADVIEVIFIEVWLETELHHRYPRCAEASPYDEVLVERRSLESLH